MQAEWHDALAFYLNGVLEVKRRIAGVARLPNVGPLSIGEDGNPDPNDPAHRIQASCVAAVPPPGSPCGGLTVGQLLSW